MSTISTITKEQAMTFEYVASYPHSLVASYFSDEERAHIREIRGLLALKRGCAHLPEQVNFRNYGVLASHLPSPYQTNAHLHSILTIVNTIFERNRYCADRAYGYIFPMNTGLMSWLMRQVLSQTVGRTVVEMGGASGENAALLACAGAKSVTLIDIVPKELELFNQNVKPLVPAESRSRLEGVVGDCTKLLELRPKLKGSVDFILCQNVLHFLNTQQQDALFDTMRGLLKPGGRVVIVANSIYCLPPERRREIQALQPDVSTFKITSVEIADYSKKEQPVVAIPFWDWEPCRASQVSTQSSDIFITRVDRKGNLTAEVDKFLTQLPRETQINISNAMEEPKTLALSKSLDVGHTVVKTNYHRIYSLTTLPNLLTKHGFQVEMSFVVDKQGRTRFRNLLDGGQQVGVIARYPG